MPEQPKETYFQKQKNNCKFLQSIQMQFTESRTTKKAKSTFKPKHSKNKISFSSFTFTDNITNNTIVMKDANQKYHHPQPSTCPAFIQQKQVDKLNNCLSMLKTTKMFQMDALRNKLFKSAHHSRTPTLDSESEIHQTKIGLKKMLKMSIDEINKKELEEWLAQPNKRISPQVMSLHSLSGHKLTRSSLASIISKKDKPVQEEPKILQNMVVESEPFQFKEENQLRQKIEHGLVNMKNNISYLIRPTPQRQLYQKLYTACKGKKTHLKRAPKSEIQICKSEEGVFRPIKLGQKVDQLQKKVLSRHKRTQPWEEKQLFYSVQNNLLFDLETLLNGKSSLIHARDKNGNNLLHAAAKNRSQQFFEILIKRTGPQGLRVKNNLGKTPLDIAKMYGVEGIVNFINNYSSPY